MSLWSPETRRCSDSRDPVSKSVDGFKKSTGLTPSVHRENSYLGYGIEYYPPIGSFKKFGDTVLYELWI